MPLTEHQIQGLFRSDAHFPACFPELADLEISEAGLPHWHKAQEQQAREHEAGAESVWVLEITEVRHLLIQRVVALRDVRSVFMPFEADPKKLSLEEGVWLIGPQIQGGEESQRNLHAAKDFVAGRGNRRGLGIAFVAESARVLNIVSITASAEESGFIHDRLALGKRDPCC